MPVIGVVVLMAGGILMYLGFSGSTIGNLFKTVFGP